MNPVREWTVLVYMNDNNNLCKGAKALLKNQLAAVEPSDRLSVAVEYSHLREPGYHYPPSITHARMALGGGEAETLPYQNMAAPETVEAFLKWGIEKYPARHYMVVFQSHGGAWRASMPDEATRVDERASCIRPDQIATAMRNVERDTGVKPEVLAFDSCLMSNLEAAYDLRDRAGLFIASEDIISSTPSEYALDYAVPLKPIFQRLSDRLNGGEQVSGQTIAADWVEACKSSWTTPTQTALDLSKIADLASAVDGLATALLDPSIPGSVLREVADRARNFGDKPNPDKWDRMFDYKIFLKDTKDLAERISSDARLSSAHDAASKVVEALHAARVAHQAQSRLQIEGRVQYGGPEFSRTEDYDAERTHGLSIYLPDNPDVVKNQIKDGNDYDALSFARDTKWDDVIRKVVSTAPREA